jgi:ParB family transcriptional regulator, chromosome partitioning protein
MQTQVINATEYRDVPLSLLNESKTNPRRTFEPNALKELAESIKTQGVLSPLLVRPLTENGFEIIAGARRYRAAQMAEQGTVPVRVVHLSDAEALAAQLVENLIRAEIHPMEEAQGFRALLDLEEPRYTIEQIAAKVGKTPSFVAQRLKLVDLVPTAVEAFYADAIGVGHALLLARLTICSRIRVEPRLLRGSCAAKKPIWRRLVSNRTKSTSAFRGKSATASGCEDFFIFLFILCPDRCPVCLMNRML